MAPEPATPAGRGSSSRAAPPRGHVRPPAGRRAPPGPDAARRAGSRRRRAALTDDLGGATYRGTRGLLRRARRATSTAEPAVRAQTKRDRDAHHQQQAEAPDHRHRGEEQHQEAGAGGQRRGRDRRRGVGGGLPDRFGRGHVTTPARCSRQPPRLLGASLELDPVVDGEADQDRQHRDRGHRQRGTEHGQQPERDPGGGERDRQRQQPETAAEHDQQRRRHHQQRGDQQARDRAGDLRGQIVDDDRHAR